MIDHALLAAYRSTVYRVRLPQGGWAGIQIDTALPAALRAWVENNPWCFITAWNPCSERQPLVRNRAAQHPLLADARALSPRLMRAGVSGVGSDWREPGWLLVGINTDAADSLAVRYQQNAYVHGHASGIARLRLC